MKALIFLIVLLLCADGFPIKAIRPKRNKDKDLKENEDDACNYAERAVEEENFVGSNLFDGFRKICFSREEMNLLVARKEFEVMLPRPLPQELLDDKAVEDILRYFYYGFWLVDRIEGERVKPAVEKAFYDTVGGFVGYYLLPIAKFSYYASKVELKTVRHVLALYHKCRTLLNTNGNGWRPPIRDPTFEMCNVRIETLKLSDENNEQRDNEQNKCSDLDLSTARSGLDVLDDNMIVSLPKLELEDPEGYLNNVWLPFSRKRTYNLRSCKSAFVFVRYYRSVSSCYKQKGMERKIFDQKFRQWIVENVKVHLGDEEFYPGLGGILNVYETLRAICNKPTGNGKRLDVDFVLGGDGKEHDLAWLTEAKSSAYADIVEGPNMRQRKRAINNEILEYIKAIQKTMPAGDEQNADNWIKAFDDSTLVEYAPKGRECITVTKCRKKCRRKKKRKKLLDCVKTKKNGTTGAIIGSASSTNKTKKNWFPWRATTCKTISLTTSISAHPPQSTDCLSTHPPTTIKPITKKAQNDSWLIRTCLCLILLVLVWLCSLLIICTIRSRRECRKRCMERLSCHKEKIMSMCKKEPDALIAKTSKSKKKQSISGRSTGKKSDKAAATKKKKKAEKADKKADQNTMKSKCKKTEKPEKLDKKAAEKAAKAAEKAAKAAEKACKDFEKAAKKAAKDKQKQKNTEHDWKYICGMRTNPQRSQQKRGSRFTPS